MNAWAPYSFKDISVLNTKTGELEIRDLAAKDDPVIQAQVKPFADADNVFNAIALADSAVKYLWSKISHLQKGASSSESQA